MNLRAGMRTFTIVERRTFHFLVWLGWIVAAAVLTNVFDWWRNPHGALPARIFIVALPLLALTFYYLPWSARLTIDLDARSARRSYRFFFVPYHVREDVLEDCIVAWGSAMSLQKVKVKAEEEGFSPAGCLLGMLLGPLLSLLLSASKSSHQEIYAKRRRNGIVLKARSGETELLLPVRDRASVQDALALIAQFAGVRQDVVDSSGGAGIR